MVAKICFVILAVGVVGATLLTLRQQRLDAVHQMAVMQRDMHKRDQQLLALRAQIKQLVLPEQIEPRALALGPMSPIGVDPVVNPLRPADNTRIVQIQPRVRPPTR
ncbi:MAG: hypothetical protein ACK51N_00685 [bacterium]|nr:hypothetical protein [Phycisphaerales bacterium]MCE2654135.1 hypothetical protein [Planctomycetaceae bacterium]